MHALSENAISLWSQMRYWPHLAVDKAFGVEVTCDHIGCIETLFKIGVIEETFRMFYREHQRNQEQDR